MNKIQRERLKISLWRKALNFAKELIGMQTPKKTIIISMMAEHKLKVRTARNLYKDAQNASDGHKRRHKSKAEAA